MTFRLLPAAAREIREAARYYEEAVPGLGFDFIAELRNAIRRILAHPQAWHPLDHQFRRCRTARFPFGIIYTLEPEGVLIVCVMHLHRHPARWWENL